MALSDFLAEREELGWYFAGLGPTVGLRAAGLEGGGGGSYDEAKSARDHLRHFDPAHRARVRRLELVSEGLRRAGQTAVGTLSLAFTPFGSGRASYRLLTAVASEGVCLVGVALRTQALDRIWRAAVGLPPHDYEFAIPEDERPPIIGLLELLEHEVSSLQRGNRIPSSHKLARVVDEAAQDVGRALGLYSVHRLVVRREHAAQRQEDRRVQLEALQRMWAAAMGGAS